MVVLALGAPPTPVHIRVPARTCPHPPTEQVTYRAWHSGRPSTSASDAKVVLV